MKALSAFQKAATQNLVAWLEVNLNNFKSCDLAVDYNADDLKHVPFRALKLEIAKFNKRHNTDYRILLKGNDEYTIEAIISLPGTYDLTADDEWEVEVIETINNWGGKREGAGRKLHGEPKRNRVFYISESEYEFLRSQLDDYRNK